MKEKAGEVFSIAKDNPPVPGCTISKEVHGGENGIIYFSLAKNTDINAEIFPDHILSQKGYYPAFHMNKKCWVSIILEDALSDEEIQNRICFSLRPFDRGVGKWDIAVGLM